MPGVPAGIRAMVAVAYRPNGVYFFVDVQDPTHDPAPLRRSTIAATRWRCSWTTMA